MAPPKLTLVNGGGKEPEKPFKAIFTAKGFHDNVPGHYYKPVAPKAEYYFQGSDRDGKIVPPMKVQLPPKHVNVFVPDSPEYHPLKVKIESDPITLISQDKQHEESHSVPTRHYRFWPPKLPNQKLPENNTWKGKEDWIGSGQLESLDDVQDANQGGAGNPGGAGNSLGNSSSDGSSTPGGGGKPGDNSKPGDSSKPGDGSKTPSEGSGGKGNPGDPSGKSSGSSGGFEPESNLGHKPYSTPGEKANGPIDPNHQKSMAKYDTLSNLPRQPPGARPHSGGSDDQSQGGKTSSSGSGSQPLDKPSEGSKSSGSLEKPPSSPSTSSGSSAGSKPLEKPASGGGGSGGGSDSGGKSSSPSSGSSGPLVGPTTSVASTKSVSPEKKSDSGSGGSVASTRSLPPSESKQVAMMPQNQIMSNPPARPPVSQRLTVARPMTWGDDYHVQSEEQIETRSSLRHPDTPPSTWPKKEVKVSKSGKPKTDSQLKSGSPRSESGSSGSSKTPPATSSPTGSPPSKQSKTETSPPVTSSSPGNKKETMTNKKKSDNESKPVGPPASHSMMTRSQKKDSFGVPKSKSPN